MQVFHCYESDRETLSPIAMNGFPTTIGQLTDLLNHLECTADGVPLALCSDKPLYCPDCGSEVDKLDSFNALCPLCCNHDPDVGPIACILEYGEVLAKKPEGK